jgi:hypothetical protein
MGTCYGFILSFLTCPSWDQFEYIMFGFCDHWFTKLAKRYIGIEPMSFPNREYPAVRRISFVSVATHPAKSILPQLRFGRTNTKKDLWRDFETLISLLFFVFSGRILSAGVLALHYRDDRSNLLRIGLISIDPFGLRSRSFAVKVRCHDYTTNGPCG